ncbi:hypothetical protein A359_05460 [secondary endosymbiont of Ctenarytaina eucalypti]|uniref:Uncharacterized protein n=1 Tax=secondary endosymbiont of Ctenarytaina eucalypti TaxID=1199245 RepID=J3YS36_9ENTR|nr:hypothetical protein A359_05460 [secondary endosymbiont of Ctenarytaina eucalypti]
MLFLRLEFLITAGRPSYMTSRGRYCYTCHQHCTSLPLLDIPVTPHGLYEPEARGVPPCWLA